MSCTVGPRFADAAEAAAAGEAGSGRRGAADGEPIGSGEGRDFLRGGPNGWVAGLRGPRLGGGGGGGDVSSVGRRAEP